MVDKNFTVCPICKGEGALKSPKIKVGEVEMKENATILLRKHGFSYREIMRLVGYKSVGSIQKILKKHHA